MIINLLKKVIGHSHNLWLGGNDEFSSSRDYKRPFTWSATGKKFTFTFWSDNNPDNYRSSEHCVHIWASKPLYQWNDVECTNKMGFICEVNHYVESYKNDIKNKCDAVKKTTSALLTEFDQIKKEQQTDLNSKLQNIRSVRDTWKTQVMKVQSSTKTSIEKILNEQEKSVKQLSEKMLKEVKHVNEELQKSTADFNNRFGEKFTNVSHMKLLTNSYVNYKIYFCFRVHFRFPCTFKILSSSNKEYEKDRSNKMFEQ